MKKYLAMCRLIGATIPSKLHLEAPHVLGALDEMCKECKVETTDAFSAFEILEVTENGDAYIPVASKDLASVKETRMRRVASRNLTGLTAPPTDPASVEEEVIDEPEYVPYEVEVAA